jgi:hypothetical protein
MLVLLKDALFPYKKLHKIVISFDFFLIIFNLFTFSELPSLGPN